MNVLWRTGKALRERASELVTKWTPRERGFFARRERHWFIIASRGRCGSHMLQTSLKHHPDIVCLAEVFNPRSRANRNPPYWDGVELPRAYLERLRTERAGTAAWFGFIGQHGQMAHHALVPSLRELAPRVVLLHRRDRLAQVCSFVIAEQTEDWGSMQPRTAHRTIRVPPEDIEKRLRQLDESVEVDRQRWHGLAIEEVAYEDLLGEDPPGLAQVQIFLGVKPLRLRPETTRLETRRPDTILENYEDVVRHLRGTAWADLV